MIHRKKLYETLGTASLSIVRFSDLVFRGGYKTNLLQGETGRAGGEWVVDGKAKRVGRKNWSKKAKPEGVNDLLGDWSPKGGEAKRGLKGRGRGGGLLGQNLCSPGKKKVQETDRKKVKQKKEEGGERGTRKVKFCFKRRGIVLI